jgi:hypothetical protein
MNRVQVSGCGRKLKLGGFNELLMAAVQQAGHMAVDQNSGRYRDCNRSVMRCGSRLDPRQAYQYCSGSVLAYQHTVCNFGVQRHIEGVCT